ncbi:MAG: epoxyqueuosine reductase [Candidatus Saccharibacteria bacterium]
MLNKEAIIDEAYRLGFVDIGFTTAEPFKSHKEALDEREASYSWTRDKGIDLWNGTDPKNIMPEAKSIIVLVENYYRGAFPPSLVGKFGRCYLDDDRVTKDGLAVRLREFRKFLRSNGIDSKVPFYLPHRLAAARAGLGTFGKNCLFYSRKAVRQGSWVSPLTIVVDQEFEPDTPTVETACPKWCKNACIAACPTGALRGPAKIDSTRCISYLSYYGDGLTPLELREPMGMWIYGCDRCQNVCPRNEAWNAQELPVNQAVAAKAEYFDLVRLLHMDRDYFKKNIWPHMFYMSPDDIWRWKMNVARVMGNSRDPVYAPELIKAFGENADERVTCMIAWALGRIGGEEARPALQGFAAKSSGQLLEEIEMALEMCK